MGAVKMKALERIEELAILEDRLLSDFVVKMEFNDLLFSPRNRCSASLNNALTDIDRLKKNLKRKSKFVCQLCDYSAKTKQHLTDHINALHLQKRDYKCSFCDKSFARHSHVKRHEDAHRNLRKYKCSLCDMAFNRKSHLDRHIETHTKGKTVFCYICKQGCRSKRSLDEHMKKHSARTEKCPACDKSFSGSIALQKHIKVKHPERYVSRRIRINKESSVEKIKDVKNEP